MTDRIAAFLVTLGTDIRDDDVQPVLAAIRMVRHVVKVEPLVTDWSLQSAQARADADWRDRLIHLLQDPLGGVS